MEKKKVKINSKEYIAKPRIETELMHPYDNPVDSWRIFKIMSEFVMGFELIRKYGVAASFFGSARYSLDDDMYKEASDLAGRLAKDGFAIITGGGPGIMEAANRGASLAGGESVGLHIELPTEQAQNKLVTESLKFHYFFTRKVMLSFASEVYVYFPGGFGTMDEFFELVTLVQTKKINKIPIILFGSEYWSPLLSWFEEALMKKYHTISPDDIKIYHVVDSVEEAHALIKKLVGEYCKTGNCK